MKIIQATGEGHFLSCALFFFHFYFQSLVPSRYPTQLLYSLCQQKRACKQQQLGNTATTHYTGILCGHPVIVFVCCLGLSELFH